MCACFIFEVVTLCGLKSSFVPPCTHRSDSLWQPPNFSVDCFIVSTKWKQAVSLNPVCWFYSSWQCAAVCRLQRHIPLWLWSLRDIRWQWMEHQGVQGWVKSTKSTANSKEKDWLRLFMDLLLLKFHRYFTTLLARVGMLLKITKKLWAHVVTSFIQSCVHKVVNFSPPLLVNGWAFQGSSFSFPIKHSTTFSVCCCSCSCLFEMWDRDRDVGHKH